MEQFAALRFYVCPARANYLLMYHELPMFERLLERGILVRNCSNYHGLEQGWFRVAVRGERENRVLVDTVRSILEEM